MSSALREAAQQALEALEGVITDLRAAKAESERDWSLLAATQESLREHMAEVQRLRAALAQPATIAEWWAAKQAASGEPADFVRALHGGKGDLDAWLECYDETEVRAHVLALVQQPAASGEPDMRHPKIQALIGGKARREIELRLVEQLLDDPDCDLSAMDMEYWHGLHDKLREKLTAAPAQPAPAPECDSPKLCAVNGACAGQYGTKKQCATAQPAPARVPLTDEQINQITAEQWGKGLGAPYAAYRAYARAIEAAHGITPAKEAP